MNKVARVIDKPNIRLESSKGILQYLEGTVNECKQKIIIESQC